MSELRQQLAVGRLARLQHFEQMRPLVEVAIVLCALALADRSDIPRIYDASVGSFKRES